MYCGQCGKRIDEDSQFCEFCGKSTGKTPTLNRELQSEVTTQKSVQPPEMKSAIKQESPSEQPTSASEKQGQITPCTMTDKREARAMPEPIHQDKSSKGKSFLIGTIVLILIAAIGIVGFMWLGINNDKEIAENPPLETADKGDIDEQVQKVEDKLSEKEAILTNEDLDDDIELDQEEETPRVAQVEKVPLALSYENHRALNVFFSNFAEVSLLPFKQGEINANELIRFGFFHHFINIPRRVDYRDYYAYVREDHIYESIQKYFDIDMNQYSFDPHSLQVEYQNGYYFFPAADGETPPFGQLSALYDNEDGTYTAHVDIYESLALDVFSYEPISNWPEEVINNTQKSRAMKALITHSGDRYILLEYLDHH